MLVAGSSGPINLELAFSTISDNSASQFPAIDLSGLTGGGYTFWRSIIDNGRQRLRRKRVE